MKRFAYIFCGILLLISYSAINTSGDTENTSSDNVVRVFGVVSDETGATVPNVSLEFASSEETYSTFSNEDGTYSLFLPKDPTGVKSSKPELFILRQNYPNPFNPSTVIEYSLDNDADVNLDIYSSTGQHVRTLVSGPQTQGIHRIVWNGFDNSGTGVAAGVYLYRLRSGNQIETKRMVLVDGAVSNPGFSRKISVPALKKQTSIDSEKEYHLRVDKKGLTGMSKSVTIPNDQQEFELNIDISATYIPFALYFYSYYFDNFYIFPADTLGIDLVGIHEIGLPSECTIELKTLTGDTETLTVSESYEIIVDSSLYGWWNYSEDRKGLIILSTDPPIPGNGILEVNAHADSIFGSYVFASGDTLRDSIAIIDSLETIVTWERTYTHWGNEWYLVSNEKSWYRVVPNFLIHFKESATENEISEFIDNNNLEVKNIHRNGLYVFYDFSDPNYIFQFMQEQEGNTIIEEISTNIAIPVGM